MFNLKLEDSKTRSLTLDDGCLNGTVLRVLFTISPPAGIPFEHRSKCNVESCQGLNSK